MTNPIKISEYVALCTVLGENLMRLGSSIILKCVRFSLACVAADSVAEAHTTHTKNCLVIICGMPFGHNVFMWLSSEWSDYGQLAFLIRRSVLLCAAPASWWCRKYSVGVGRCRWVCRDFLLFPIGSLLLLRLLAERAIIFFTLQFLLSLSMGLCVPFFYWLPVTVDFFVRFIPINFTFIVVERKRETSTNLRSRPAEQSDKLGECASRNVEKREKRDRLMVFVV